jgi:hypothetical protein
MTTLPPASSGAAPESARAAAVAATVSMMQTL